MSASPEPVLDDVRIRLLQPLIPPACLLETIPMDDPSLELVARSRDAIRDIITGADDRLLVFLGPDCVHDKHGALAYANMLLRAKEEYAAELLVVMQVDFETPRKSTSAAWKGLINDPDIAGHPQINKGLTMARELLTSISRLGIPISMEFLDTIMPQFTADTVSFGMFSGRTSESQVHRELASGLSCPVAFYNATDGAVQQAVDACQAAKGPHSFLSVTKEGMAAIVHTTGNPSCFPMLAGTPSQQLHTVPQLEAAAALLSKAGLPPVLGVDCAHSAGEDLELQRRIVKEVSEGVAQGAPVIAVLLESYLQGGAQEMPQGRKPSSSLSLTSPCLDWATTEDCLQDLAAAVRTRRGGSATSSANVPPPKRPKA